MSIAAYTIAESFQAIENWQKGRSGSFLTALLEARSHADGHNTKLLEKVYPNLMYAYACWAGEIQG